MDLQLTKINFTVALVLEVATYKHGNKIDHVYTKNMKMVNIVINDSLDNSITDHWCIKATLKAQQ